MTVRIKWMDVQRICSDCRRCLSACPPKAICITEQGIRLSEELCWGCGRCAAACPKGLFSFVSQREQCRQLLSREAPVAVCYEPWMEQYVSGIELPALLRSLGFTEAASTACQERELQTLGRKPVISSRCPVVNVLICERYPQLLPHLAKRKTPAELFGAERKAVSPELRVVSITACPAQAPGDGVDAVLPLAELLTWLREEGTQITPSSVLTLPEAQASGGPVYRVEGLEACERLLQACLSQGLLPGQLELFACPGGCAGAPGVPGQPAVLHRLPSDAASPRKDTPPARALYQKKYAPAKSSRLPGQEALLAAHAALGTLSPADRQDCGRCGYPTCEAAARAVCEGRLPKERCVVHQLKYYRDLCNALLEGFPAGIFLLQPDLTPIYVNQKGESYLPKPRRGISPERRLWQLLNRQELERALSGEPVKENKPVYAGRLDLIQQTAFLPAQGLLLCTLLPGTGTEMAEERQQNLRDETRRITQRVMDRQRETVQELCNLLGEAAARNEGDLIWLKEYTIHV